MVSGSLCLVDAMVLVDGVKHGFLDALLDRGGIAVVESALREVKYYRDAKGEKIAIDLAPRIRSGKLTVVASTSDELWELLSHRIQRRLGQGELESLALVLAYGHTFCTADRLAVRAMRDLGVLSRWISLEELLGALGPPRKVPDAKYSRAAAEPK